jgi:hypothetical protein
LRRLLFAVALLVPGTLSADTLTLAWDPVFDSTVAGYRVYVGTASGAYTQVFDAGYDTTFSFTQAVPGTRYYFAVASYAAGPVIGSPSIEVSGYSNQFPTLQNPGTRSSSLAQSVLLQLVGSDPDGKPVSYSASGLPPGLLLTTSTGLIAGTTTAAGSFAVTVRVSDGVLTTSAQFTWTVSSVVSKDATPPQVVVSSPVTTPFDTLGASVLLVGAATDNVGVKSVTWANNRGGSGNASGVSAWQANVALQPGSNTITLTAQDAAGNRGTKSVTVNYVLPPTLISPLDITTGSKPTYKWTARPAAVAYGLQVTDAKGTRSVFGMSAAQAGCATTATCSFTPSITLAGGTAYWKVETIVVNDIGAWSATAHFKVSP